MKTKKTILLLMSALLLIPPLLAVNKKKSKSNVSTRKKITLTDSRGRKITINQPVKKIAFSHYSVGEGLKIVDAWDMVVARDGYTADKIIFPNLDRLPQISKNPYTINYELMFDLGVDVLITADLPLAGFDEMAAKLEPEIQVFAINLQNPATIEKNIINLGLLLGKEKNARQYIEWYNKVIHQIEKRTKRLKKDQKIRYFQRTSRNDGIMTFTDDYPGIAFRNKLTGSINVAGKLPSKGGWVQAVDPEWFVSQDIETIINFDIVPRAYGTEIDDYNRIKKYRKRLLDNPLYSHLAAVKKNQFYMIANEFWGTTRNIISFAYMAKWFHPRLFSDFDPRTIHQEYLSRFMRIDFDLNEHGVFVYPEN